MSDHQVIQGLRKAISSGNSEMMKAVFEFAIHTGCRLEELASLKASHATLRGTDRVVSQMTNLSPKRPENPQLNRSLPTSRIRSTLGV